MGLAIDNNENILLSYSKEDILKIMRDLQICLKLQPKNLFYREAASTNSKYLHIVYNRQDYDIRFVDRTYSQSADTDKALLNCRYDRVDNEFIIEISIYKYSADYILKTIKKIDKAIKFFSDAKEKQNIRQFIIEHENDEKFTDYDGFIEPFETIKGLALMYLEENNIQDNPLNTKFAALCKIMSSIFTQRKRGK